MNDPVSSTPRVSAPASARWVSLLLCGAGVLLTVLLAVAVAKFIWPRQEHERVSEPKSFPLPPLSTSPFLNTRPNARYIGSEACRTCHEDRHASFRRSGMGRSMAIVDLAREPHDASFDHPLSKRRYQVRRKDGQLWHRELLLTGGSQEVVLAEYPLKYVVGSGRHSLTYLVEIDGFLVESPVTWYTARKAWGMSPGYDRPEQGGFDRATGLGCLFCHAGQSEAIGGSLHRMRVSETAIGCERCHGPGSLHAERHAGRKAPGKRPREAVDYTIVNPSRLPRGLAEAVCQQCHLRTSATIVGRGRKPGDFRPGLPREDFHQDYRLEVPDAPMTVTGHVEQMHLSRCYQRSDSLTCLTCHDPHDEPEPRERVERYRSICLQCHQAQHCKVSPARRQKESPANDCVFCHMPTSPTEIPHLAFTHHRIGIHDRAATAKTAPRRGSHGPGVLRPFGDLSRLGDIDRKRSLGLGYLEVANREHDEARAASYREEALQLLSVVRNAGLRDPALDAGLARLHFDLRLAGASACAESALAQASLDGEDRCVALFLLADGQAEQGNHEEAIRTLRQLTRLRRHPEDWLRLAKYHAALGQEAVETEALEATVRINPRFWQVHEYLAERFRKQGDAKRAAWHQQRAVR
jgi:predicted CXXCH cytochrome family protein